MPATGNLALVTQGANDSGLAVIKSLSQNGTCVSTSSISIATFKGFFLGCFHC